MDRFLQLSQASLFLAALVWVNFSFAGNAIDIVRAEGKITISDTQEGQQNAVGLNGRLPSKVVLTTGSDGRAVIRVGNTGLLVVDKSSKIEINLANHAGFFRQVSGIIFYAINAIKDKSQVLEIKTQTATIGVRGTRFVIVDIPGRNEIGMQKGVLSVMSLNEEFEVHRQVELDEFEKYKQAGENALQVEKDGFDAFKQKSSQDFVTYKKEFTLGAERMVSFAGKRVDDLPLSAEARQNIANLEIYARVWLDEIRD
ncbi:MAG: FecR family protein [Gallionellaceae bacterium]|jgi:hypothetical protein